MNLLSVVALALAAPSIPLQGVLTSASGAPLNGPHTVTTEIWTAATPEGTPTLAWSGEQVVAFAGGAFSSPIQLDPAGVAGPTPEAIQAAERVLVAVGVAGVGLTEPTEVGQVWRASRADSVPWSGVTGAVEAVTELVETTLFSALSVAGLVSAGSIEASGAATAGSFGNTAGSYAVTSGGALTAASVTSGGAVTGASLSTSGAVTAGSLSATGAVSAASYTGGNTGNWNTAFDERRQWSGVATNLDAALARASLGLGALATQGAVAGGTAGTIQDGTVTNADLSAGTFSSITGVGTLGSLTVSGTVNGPAFRVRAPTSGVTELIEYGSLARIHHDNATTAADLLSVAGARAGTVAAFSNAGAGPALVVPAGRVGIGMTNPAFPLDVTGNAHITGNLKVDGHTTAVAFSAHDSSGDWCKNCGNAAVDSEANNRRVVMNVVDVNVGNAYNASTGELTAPSAGLYMICLNFLHGDQTDDYLNIRVWINDNWPTFASDHFMYDSGDYVPWRYMHGCQMVPLSAGDRLGLQVYGSRGIYEDPDENHERMYGWKL